jgi:hypothetical protein
VGKYSAGASVVRSLIALSEGAGEGGSARAEGAELECCEPPSVGLLDPYLAEADGERHLVAPPGGAAVLRAADDCRLVIVPHVYLGCLDGQVAEVAVPADPLLLAELEALLADGQEVVCEQGAETAGVAVQLGVVKGALELKDVVFHGLSFCRGARRGIRFQARNALAVLRRQAAGKGTDPGQEQIPDAPALAAGGPRTAGKEPPIWTLSAAKYRLAADAHNRVICGDELLPVYG